MTLDCSVRVRVGALDLAVDLSVGDETLAILGPNGAGKTTLLRVLAGLQPVDAGRVVVDDQVLDDPAAGVFVPPEHRPIGVVFQDYLLFPFLSARDNVAFGLRSRGVRRTDARARADEWLVRFGLHDARDARPGHLSGGQSQRVALARAVVTEPRLLLLDEPLAALDAGARIDIRRALRDELARLAGARLVVTHDPVDVVALADRVVVLERGRVAQEGTMDDIAMHPRSGYVADLVGTNLYRGHAHDGVVMLERGGEIIVADHGHDGAVYVAIHPRTVALHLVDPGGSVRNHWSGRVDAIEGAGDRVRVRVDAAVPIVAEVTRESLAGLGLALGDDVVAAVKASEVLVYPA
jgi:molybdate transport system ATP-binding protein